MHIRFLAPVEDEMLEAAAYYEIRVKSLGENFSCPLPGWFSILRLRSE